MNSITSLPPILGYSEILTTEQDRSQLKKGLEGIRTAAFGAQRIVNSLLLFARREKPAKKRCDVNDIVKNSCNMLGTLIGGPEVKICLDLNSALPPVMADPHQIEQVVTNILKNAVDALEGQKGEIRLKTDSDRQDVVITVSDNGPGIPGSILKNIFDPFFSTKQKKNGTGLGLSICHGIMKEHGGNIEVSSRAGETRFTLRLLVMEWEDEGAVLASEADMVNFNFETRPRILVVDDEYEISQLLLEVFSGEFLAVKALNGMEALERIRRNSFDVIISDLKMPELSGMEMYERLLEEFPRYRDRVIFTTGVVSDL